MPQRPTHLQLLRETLPTAYSGRFDAAAECCQKATLPLQALLQLFFLQFLRRQQQRQPGGWERVGGLAPQQRCASTSRQTTARRAASTPKQHHYHSPAQTGASPPCPPYPCPTLPSALAPLPSTPLPQPQVPENCQIGRLQGARCAWERATAAVQLQLQSRRYIGGGGKCLAVGEWHLHAQRVTCAAATGTGWRHLQRGLGFVCVIVMQRGSAFLMNLLLRFCAGCWARIRGTGGGVRRGRREGGK